MIKHGNLEIAELISKGMARFPGGPPKCPFLEPLADRIARIAETKDAAERDGAVSALILSLRGTEDATYLHNTPVQQLGEELIEAASAYVDACLEDGHALALGPRITLRAAHNRLQAVYAACVQPEALAEPEEASSAPSP